MITYDYNFVNVDFYVEYRVTDPIRFLYNSDDPVAILKMLCQSYIRDTIGLYDVDSVITTGKSEIQADIKEKIVKRLDQEDLGIQLTNITIQDAEPPTAEVQQAFTAVETAKQGADTAVNNAKKYANEVTPAAEADADEIIKQAEAYKQSKINEATGQAARFSSLFSEYEKYPLITKQRLFYEAMIFKPFDREDIADVLERAKLLHGRQRKRYYFHTFGVFDMPAIRPAPSGVCHIPTLPFRHRQHRN